MKKDIAIYLVKTMQDTNLPYEIKNQLVIHLNLQDVITYFDYCFLKRYAKLCHGLPIIGHIITAP